MNPSDSPSGREVFSGRKPYNPRRPNGLDSAVVYLITLVCWLLLGFLLGYVLDDFLRAVVRYDYYLYLVVNLFFSQGLLFLIAFCYCRVRRFNPFAGGGYVTKWDGVQILMCMLLVAGIMVSFFYTHAVFGYDMADLFGTEEITVSDIPTSPLSPFFVFVYLILTAVCPAVVEEMLFRGIVLRGLEQFGSVFAILCSSLMFSFLHGSFQMMILQFLIGVAIAVVVTVTGNCLLGSVMHFFNNSFAVVAGLFMNHSLSEVFPSDAVYLFGSLTDAVIIVFGVICLFVSVLYFGSMIVEREKNKALGKKPAPFGISYAVADERTGVVAFRDVSEKAEYYGETASELLFVRGKFRRNTKRASSVLCYVLLGVGLLFALALIFV